MHPLQTELAQQAAELTMKLGGKKKGAPVLFKYQDPEGNTFWLDSKKTTIKSPYSGKSFSFKPERDSMFEVTKDLKEKAQAKIKSAGLEGPQAAALEAAATLMAKTATPVLWKYQDPEGNAFWLDSKKTTVKSPFSGKSFTTKPEKDTINEVGQDLRDEAKAKTASDKPEWKRVIANVGEMTEEKTKAFAKGIDKILKDHKDTFAALNDLSMDLAFLADDQSVAMDPVLGPLFKKTELKLDQVFDAMVTPELQKLKLIIDKRIAEAKRADATAEEF